MITINKIVKNNLCTGCGTCVGVCKNDAIEMIYKNNVLIPKLIESKCTYCNLCIKCCPGNYVNMNELNSFIFNDLPNNSYIGNYLNCYVGHSINDAIRLNSSSGGIVTSLLTYVLNINLIDEVIVVKMDPNNPLKPMPFIAKNKEEIFMASKSKYSPVAVNQVIKEIMNNDKKYALVGLPCHIHGIRKSEYYIKYLKDKIILLIGLMCSHTVNYEGTKFILKKFKIKIEDVKNVQYRVKDWPGSMSIQLKNGENISIPYVGTWYSYWPIFSSGFFRPIRCLSCPDETNELADISCGDAWLPEFKDEKKGKSVIITRSHLAERLLSNAVHSGIISATKIAPHFIVKSQSTPLKYKKEDISSRYFLMKLLGMRVPNIITNNKLKFNYFSLIRNIFILINCKLSYNEYFKKMLYYIPFPIFRLYYGIFKYLSKI